MALYYDAVSILSSAQTSGSLKSRVYNSTTLRAKPAQVYALISEATKRDVFLKEVLDNTDLLKNEPKLTPLLSLLLCHDHFFSNGGIAAPAKHPLRLAIERHKARLQSEFTRARLRRKCASLPALKEALNEEKGSDTKTHPRWARINALKARDRQYVLKSFRGCNEKPSLTEVLTDEHFNGYYHDPNIPDLLALSPKFDATGTEAYKHGEMILQDKASCFPAHLLLGGCDVRQVGDIIDGCAAPGNKTTHLAAIAFQIGAGGKIYACERDAARSKTLQSMVAKAGTDSVQVLARQDFLALDPEDKRFSGVTHLLLDPSCSGSGILGREDIPRLALPNDPRAVTSTSEVSGKKSISNKKRKRSANIEAMTRAELQQAMPANEEEAVPISLDQERLEKLSNLQTRIVEHAMKFPGAVRVTYSTCSIHEQENEVVVSRVLASEVAQSKGWRVLRREEQVEGMKKWRHRGVRRLNRVSDAENMLSPEELEACIRCFPHDEEGTMGFFVCAFFRDQTGDFGAVKGENAVGKEDKGAENIDEEDEWGGFD